MYTSALLLLIPWWLSGKVETKIPPGSESFVADEFHDEPPAISEGFMVVFRSYYLTMIALFIIVMNLINTNGEYIVASFVTQEADKLLAAGELLVTRDVYMTQFYSSYNTWFTLIGFLIQLFLVSRIFDKIGVRGAILVLPALMMINYTLMFLFPVLAVARYAMIAENSTSYSLQNTIRHALFLPVRREEKYVGKNCIDTFFYRFGDVLSALAIYLGSSVIGFGLSGFVIANGVLALVLFWFSWIIGQRNKDVIEENFGNMPPLACLPIPDIDIPSGQLSQFDFDEETFVDPDEGDALKYRAFLNHQDDLPRWVRFDPLRRTFRVTPPADAQGAIVLRVVAIDFDGLEAELNFTLSYS